MRILALDLATKTGYACWNGERVESGVQDFSLKRGESPGMRYLWFNRWLDNILLQPHHRLDEKGNYVGSSPIVSFVELIVYEACHNRGGAATEVANGFTTRVQEFCARYDIEHASVHTATLKKRSTGSGRASKDEMIAACRKRWNIEPIDDNHADALMIMSYALEEYGNGRVAK